MSLCCVKLIFSFSTPSTLQGSPLTLGVHLLGLLFSFCCSAHLLALVIDSSLLSLALSLFLWILGILEDSGSALEDSCTLLPLFDDRMCDVSL